MLARLIFTTLIIALAIFAIGLPGNSFAQAGQSQDAFETAIRDKSTSPYIVLITVVDDRTGQARTGCTAAPFLLGAIYIEKWGAIEKDASPKTDARFEEIGRIAVENASHVFHFAAQAALDNVPLRFPEACTAIEQGSRARIQDRTGRVIFGPFVEGPEIDRTSCPRPAYPPEAKATGEGATTISLLVGPDGHLKDSKVSESSGSVRQDEAVRAALSACKFRPRTVDGQPTPDAVWMTMRIGNRAVWPGAAGNAAH